MDITPERLKNVPEARPNEDWDESDRTRNQEVYDYWGARVTYYWGAE